MIFFCSKVGNVILDFLNHFLQKRCWSRLGTFGINYWWKNLFRQRWWYVYFAFIIYYTAFFFFKKNFFKKYLLFFWISDDGLQDINNVFTDSSTYQPEVPSNDAEILVHTRLIPILILLLNSLKKEMELKLDELDYHFRYFKNRILKMKLLMVNLSLTIPLVKMWNLPLMFWEMKLLKI